MRAFLILEDGTVFEGTHIGADKEIISEIVFNTSMAGYLEVLTGPSYAGQAVCMTYPLIGNFGICRDDMESRKPWLAGFIVKELSRVPSNFRYDCTIQQFLEENEIPGIAGIDTRALARRLREQGTMNGMITTNENYKMEEVLPKIKAYKAASAVQEATCAESYTIAPVTDIAQNGAIAGMARFVKEDYEKGIREPKPSCVRELDGAGLKVAFLDLGAKKSLTAALTARGCEVCVFPASATAEEILGCAPNGIFLSDGPGNPKDCEAIVAEIKKLYESNVPVFATGLGHELMALAAGGDTEKLKCGHRGVNYPVKDLETGKVSISAQNHGYVVVEGSLSPEVAVPAFVNVNDGTNEGYTYTGKKILTVQFYPDADVKAQGSEYLYQRFMKMMKGEN